MLSGLSEYLFGSSATKVDETPAAEEEASKQDPSPVEESEMEDDWVLVDVTNESDTSSPRRSPRRPKKASCSSCPKNIPDKPHRMEESWFITPPPCFTAGGHSPQQLATSPMEDLLIEHPSMSVYHHPGQHGSCPTHRDLRRQHHPRQKPSRTVARRTHNLRVRTSKPPRRAAAVAARVGIEQPASEAAREEQVAAKRQQQRHHSRGKIERHNKAYHQQSASSRRHYCHISSASGRHSGAIYKQPR